MHALYCQPDWFQRLCCGLARRVGKEVTCFHFKRCASTRSKLHLLPTRLVSGVLCGLAHHVGMKWLAFTSRAASIGSKLHYCQPDSFQSFLVAWLIVLVRGDMFSPQKLCFHGVQAALLPARLVPEVLCGLAHHLGREDLLIARAVLSLGPCCTIANHAGFRGSLLLRCLARHAGKE